MIDTLSIQIVNPASLFYHALLLVHYLTFWGLISVLAIRPFKNSKTKILHSFIQKFALSSILIVQHAVLSSERNKWIENDSMKQNKLLLLMRMITSGPPYMAVLERLRLRDNSPYIHWDCWEAKMVMLYS